MFFKLLNFPFVAFFVFILFFGSIFSLSSVHWFGVWLGLELNLISFIPIMVQTGKMEEVEASTKYFLVQAVASSLLLMSSLLLFWKEGNWELTSNKTFVSSILILFSLLMKLGAAPFHFWVPSVVSGLSWLSNILLLTWQKVVPLLSICLFFSIVKEMLMILVLFASFFGGVGGLNQTSIRGILSYSSILHMGWMMSSSSIGMEICFLYLFMYSLILISCLLMFMFQETKSNKQFFNVFLWKDFSRMYLFMMILSLGGMPPLLGFFAKWMVLTKLVNMNMILIPYLLILGSMISLYYYLNLSFSVILSYEMTWKSIEMKSSIFFLMAMMLFNMSGFFLMSWLSSLI